MIRGSNCAAATVERRRVMASLDGMKRVAVSGRAEGLAEERRLAQPPKSPAPTSASRMFLSCIS